MTPAAIWNFIRSVIFRPQARSRHKFCLYFDHISVAKEPLCVTAAATTWNCQNSDHHLTVHSSSKDTSFHTWLIAYRSSSASDSLLADELWRRYTNRRLID